MSKKIIAGGCSFTFGHELSDDVDGKIPSTKSWAYGLFAEQVKTAYPGVKYEYIPTSKAGIGNQAIARKTFQAVSQHEPKDIQGVVVMWSFISRYDWAMPRHRLLEDTRWLSISPWDTTDGSIEAFRTMQGSETQQEHWRTRQDSIEEMGLKSFANAIYKYAANEYHELYLSWKSIIWLQNLLEKKGIKYMFTLADNSLFYKEFAQHKDQDSFMNALYNEIDFTKWFSFGERMMGFNQWSIMENYERGTTHPLDKAHEDAIKLMLPTYKKLVGGK